MVRAVGAEILVEAGNDIGVVALGAVAELMAGLAAAKTAFEAEVVGALIVRFGVAGKSVLLNDLFCR